MRVEFNLKDKHGAVQSLWTAVNEGGGWLSSLPQIVKTVIETEAWRERQDGERVYRHETFRDFITAPPRSGCGWPLDKVEKLIKDDPETLAMWRKAVTAPKHVHAVDNDNIIIKSLNNNIIQSKPQQGTSRAYTLDRLSREAPGLYEAVCRGEMSANKAAIEAGFRKRPQPFEQIKKLVPKLSDEERRQLRELL